VYEVHLDNIVDVWCVFKKISTAAELFVECLPLLKHIEETGVLFALSTAVMKVGKDDQPFFP